MTTTLDIQAIWRAVFGEDVVSAGRRLPGDQYRVMCPWHSERNASCDVSVAKNVYLCRSCGAQGGALSVVVREGLARDNREALDWLKRHGVAC